MIEILDKIYALIALKLQKKYFVFRFYQYNGREENQQIKIANSREYTFINSGSTVVVLNDNLYLYPSFMQNPPNQITFTCNENEQDETVYKYKFRQVNFDAGNSVVSGDVATSWLYDAGSGQSIPKPNIDATLYDQPVNLLQVIIKERAVKDNILKVKK